MKKILLTFPGQGSQSVGMGKEFYDKFPASKNIIDKLDDELKNVIFNGPEESLKDTKYAQELNDEAVRLLDEYSVKALNVFDDICKRLTDG